MSKGFKMAKKTLSNLLSRLYRVHRSKRMALLQAALKCGFWVSRDEVEEKRRQFQLIKSYLLLILPDTKCYVCDRKATDRHHVLPLCKGGLNDPKNLVPLCKKCHKRLDLTSTWKQRGGGGGGALYQTHNLQIPQLSRYEIKALNRGSLSPAGKVVAVMSKKTEKSTGRLPAPKATPEKAQSTTISLGKVEAKLLEPAWHYALPLQATHG